MTRTVHGTRGCYKHGCRRPECVAAEAAYQSARRDPEPYAPSFGGIENVPAPGAWALDGACRSADIPVNIFFPGRGDTSQPARNICATCTVKPECRAYALAAPDALKGIWAGTSGRERRILRRQQNQGAA